MHLNTAITLICNIPVWHCVNHGTVLCIKTFEMKEKNGKTICNVYYLVIKARKWFIAKCTQQRLSYLNGLAYIIKTADMHIPVSGSIALMMSYCVHKWSLVGVGWGY